MIDEPKNITEETTTDPAATDVRVPPPATSLASMPPDELLPHDSQSASAETPTGAETPTPVSIDADQIDSNEVDVKKSTELTDPSASIEAAASPDDPATAESSTEVPALESAETENSTEAEVRAESDEASLIEAATDDDRDDSETVDSSGAIEEIVDDSHGPIDMDWYILKVQSNRERSIAEALQRKVVIEGLDRFFGQVIVPTEKVTEFKGGKKKIVERKLWPGYIVVQMHINDDTWFAVRETSGIGDFTGAVGKPTPMQPHEVARVIQTEEEESEESPKLAIKFDVGDKVKVKDGNFENFEGEVGSIDEASGKVTIMINIFGRSTPVELEYWQIEAV